MEDFHKIEINLSKEEYEQINKYVTLYNSYEQVKKRFNLHGTIEDFIKGSIRRELKCIENHDQVFCELKTKGYIRPVNIKTRFREIMKEMGLKQIEIEDMTGIGGNDISGYMNNRKKFSLDHFLRIWIVLGCPDITELLYVE